MIDCIFCQIISKSAKAKIVFENDQVLCFFPKIIEVYGHTLVVPKGHFESLYNIPDNVLCELSIVLKRLSLDYRRILNATGVNILHASGISAQQSVPHFHFHLLPRFKDDKIDAWPKLPKIEIDEDKLWQRIKVG